jgi:hypothetical protein
MGVTVVPCTLREANSFVRRHHRHHGPARGHKFGVGAADESGAVRGVAIVGRPVARAPDDGWTLEVLRVATDGFPNVCSCLYAACWRAAHALGYRRLVTYTLNTELGVSLRAAAWRCVGEAVGGRWSRRDRPRADDHPTQGKFRWEAT